MTENQVCEGCPKTGILQPINKMMLCEECYAKELLTSAESKTVKSIEVIPSTEEINHRLKKAYIDKFNSLLVSDMSHEQIKYHIADLEDMVKVLNTQLQATMDVDDKLSAELSAEDREILRVKDKAHRMIARPIMNSDGTLKLKPKAAPKPVIVGDSGTKAFESLVEKLVRTGMTKDAATKMIQGMKK